jgi:ATP-binding cassette subfamily B protein
MLIFPVRQIGRILVDLGKMRVSLGRIFEILNAPAETETPGADFYSLKGDIEFKNVSFKFPDSDEHMLRNINFSIKSGRTIGILGPTGAGKSTLTHILLRLYDYEGSIKINGIELRYIKKDCARKKIGLALQDSFLFSKTINENIKMANLKSSDMDVRKVARSAKIHDVIENFESGYETVVGERGVTLSGGQKQRVAIARTLIKNADILIFDDSLSAVDAETDAKIRAELKLRAADVTTFLISQRVTTLKEADIIMTLEKGEISSKGTHEELISKEGLYKKIWDLQSALEAELESS